MNLSNIAMTLTLTGSVLLSAPTFAAPDPLVDPNASVIFLRSSCDIANTTDPLESPMENCFEDMNSLRDWVYNRADMTAKLLIDIGPGQFGNFGCTNEPGGDLTFRGSGVDKTIISGFFSGVGATSCTDLNWSFEDMTIKGAYAGVFIGPTKPVTTWTNVVMDGRISSWYEQLDNGVAACAAGNGGVHRFFSSRLIGRGTNQTAFLNRCGDDWFWGSEIVLFAHEDSTSGVGILSEGSGNRVHLYGSNLRVELPNGSNQNSGSLTGIDARWGGEVHSHGVGIDVIAVPGWTATALAASNGSHVHANESSYFFGMSTSGINIQRIWTNAGTVHAPHQWRTGTNPPSITSKDGADTAIVTGGTSDGHPHMVVYDSSCTSNWYDLTDGACRP